MTTIITESKVDFYISPFTTQPDITLSHKAMEIMPHPEGGLTLLTKIFSQHKEGLNPKICVVFNNKTAQQPLYTSGVPHYALECKAHLPPVLSNNLVQIYCESRHVQTTHSMNYEDLNFKAFSTLSIDIGIRILAGFYPDEQLPLPTYLTQAEKAAVLGIKNLYEQKTSNYPRHQIQVVDYAYVRNCAYTPFSKANPPWNYQHIPYTVLVEQNFT